MWANAQQEVRVKGENLAFVVKTIILEVEPTAFSSPCYSPTTLCTSYGHPLRCSPFILRKVLYKTNSPPKDADPLLLFSNRVQHLYLHTDIYLCLYLKVDPYILPILFYLTFANSLCKRRDI